MANPIGSIPEFTNDDGAPAPEQELEEVKQISTEEVEEEKETPAEPPAESTEVEQTPAAESSEDTENQEDLERAKLGLHQEIVKLRKEVSELRGQRREIKQDKLLVAEQKLEELQDVSPDDVNLIERVLKAKGYVKKDEVEKTFYERVKQDKLNVFLEKYPELKPENDPGDLNWSALQRELGYYRMPEDPNLITEVLERAYKNTVKVRSDVSVPAKKRAIAVASVGAGGTQNSSSRASLDPAKRQALLDGGWSEEDIQQIELNLPE